MSWMLHLLEHLSRYSYTLVVVVVVLISSNNAIYLRSMSTSSLSSSSENSLPLSLPSSSASTCSVRRSTSKPIFPSSSETSSAFPGAVTTTATEDCASKRGRKCVLSAARTSALVTA